MDRSGNAKSGRDVADAPLVDAFARPADEVLAALGSSLRGLPPDEVQHRLERYGPNALEAVPPRSLREILLDQLKSVVVALLFAATAIAYLLGDPLDAAAIGAVLVINTVLGFVTELRARRAVESLLRLAAPRATVVRDGATREIPARELVPGDIVAVEAGQSVPADARVVRSVELRVDEAPLTGESLPVGKHPDPVPPDMPLPERTSMIYSGTTVAAGTGHAVVTATGMATELGRIGRLAAGVTVERTPLERRMDALGKRLIWIALAVAALVTAIGLLQGAPLGRMIETGIALAIAAVPEGLPAVTTITLAVGVRRMARRRALVRRLPAVEALGAATVVCTDKTGTLTAGEMTLTTLWLAGRELRVTGTGYTPAGECLEDGTPVSDDAALDLALRTATLASRGAVEREDGRWTPRGDPTDVAFLVAGRKDGIDRDALLERAPLVHELPFSSERMFLASFHRENDGITAYVKGAPARVLALCDSWLAPDGVRPLDDEMRRTLHAHNETLARRGLRVLALAAGPVRAPEEAALGALRFVALAGLIDPAAPGVQDTIRRFRDAGVRTLMLTGDQRVTAEAVARDLGVITQEEASLGARELDRLSDMELAERIGHIGVFSRISPEDKLRIVSALQERREIVAMLGDGVNDAAALRKADIGVAMGIRGTDVAREAADVILQDDRFQTIGAAVEEGRIIFDNIRKFVFYLFSCNAAEVLVLMIAGAAGLPLPLLPLQILWLNIVTDTFPALALALEPAEPDIMRRPPRSPGAALLSGPFLRAIGLYAALITAVTLGVFLWGLGNVGAPTGRAVTLGFMTLALAQIFHLGNARSAGPVIRPGRAGSNPYAVAAAALSVGLQLLAVYWPPLASILRLEPIAPADWLVVAPLAVLPAVIGQVLKLAGLSGGARP